MPNPGKPTSSQTRFATFGSLPRDANRQVMASHDNYFVTEDATPTTPITSPVAVSNSASTTLNVPAAAGQVTFVSSVALRVSEDSTMSKYMVIPPATPVTFPCMTPAIDQQLTNLGALYIQGDAASAIVQFRFDCI